MKNNSVRQIATGVITSVVSTVLMGIITTFLVSNGKIAIGTVKWIALMINGISVLLGCVLGVLSGNIKAPVLCGIVTVAYMIILLITNWLFAQQMRAGWGYSILVAVAAAVTGTFLSAAKPRGRGYFKHKSY